jgi:protein-S-isoprenylcysteine O-methyltransferase Ste14
MAKLMIWILQGAFFAQFGIFILLGFILIYMLRAWTEERHLSRDPDYLAYKQSVRWWFIPGVI